MNVLEKAEALYQAWEQFTRAPPPSKTAVVLALAQATHETQCGDAWPSAHNWGATDYRPPTAAESMAIVQGVLKAGYWLLPDGTWVSTHSSGAVAVLHTDTTPTKYGPQKYSMWFAAFPSDVAGATYFLKIVLHMLLGSVRDPNLTAESWATSCYIHGYFEGVHPGARPVWNAHGLARQPPLNAAELANVRDYAGAMLKLVPELSASLANWNPVFSGTDPDDEPRSVA